MRQRLAPLLLSLLFASSSWSQTLPQTVAAALTQAQVPHQAAAIWVGDAATGAARLSHQAQTPLNPASVMKLLTTFSALELLGPGYTFRTPVFLGGPIKDGALQGNLYIQGGGDPKLTTEQLWLLLRRVQGLGISSIAGDIVLDHSAFAPIAHDPAEFDGEPLRAYNASADALLINFKSVFLRFVPNAPSQTALIHMEPPLAGVALQPNVPMQTSDGDCGDYRTQLKADFSNPAYIRFNGAYKSGCGEKTWTLAYAEPASYATRAVQGVWQNMGGQLTGRVRSGLVPAGVAPSFEHSSQPLAELIRDINKFSNNVMTQQVFLTLGRKAGEAATQIGARQALQTWWNNRFGSQDAPQLDQGSGLSRQQRISAQALVHLLQAAYQSPLMPEFMASLPMSGVDGTLRSNASSISRGQTHLKTGSLQGVVALAGYVHPPNGKPQIVVVLINHPNAQAARPAMQAVVDWALTTP